MIRAQGIFNGSRNNTPTPVRPAVASAQAVAPAGPLVIQPPRTGDAGLAKTLRLPSTW